MIFLLKDVLGDNGNVLYFIKIVYLENIWIFLIVCNVYIVF